MARNFDEYTGWLLFMMFNCRYNNYGERVTIHFVQSF